MLTPAQQKEAESLLRICRSVSGHFASLYRQPVNEMYAECCVDMVSAVRDYDGVSSELTTYVWNRLRWHMLDLARSRNERYRKADVIDIHDVDDNRTSCNPWPGVENSIHARQLAGKLSQEDIYLLVTTQDRGGTNKAARELGVDKSWVSRLRRSARSRARNIAEVR